MLSCRSTGWGEDGGSRVRLPWEDWGSRQAHLHKLCIANSAEPMGRGLHLRASSGWLLGQGLVHNPSQGGNALSSHKKEELLDVLTLLWLVPAKSQSASMVPNTRVIEVPDS